MRRNFLEHSDEFLAVVEHGDGVLHPRRSQASLKEEQVVRVVIRDKNEGWCFGCGLLIDELAYAAPLAVAKTRAVSAPPFDGGGNPAHGSRTIASREAFRS